MKIMKKFQIISNKDYKCQNYINISTLTLNHYLLYTTARKQLSDSTRFTVVQYYILYPLISHHHLDYTF